MEGYQEQQDIANVHRDYTQFNELDFQIDISWDRNFVNMHFSRNDV